jgi:flavin-dependent dehydrogenase
MSDICVIGGGPAGSTFATRMAQLGHRVHLVERACFPRRRLGESLSAGVLPLLAAAGLDRHVADSCKRAVPGVEIDWDDGPRLRDNPRGGLIVERGAFDLCLLESARAASVRVHQPARVTLCEKDDARWRIRIESAGETAELRVDFLADARGRRRARQVQTGPQTLAVHRYWRPSRLPERPRIEAGMDVWYWGVPLPDGTYNTIVFLDPRSWRSMSALAPSERLDRWLQRSSLMTGCGPAEPASAVLACDATPYLAETFATANSIRIGDAALAIDPLSSSGVQKAVQGALAAAIVVNTLLRKPERREAALQFYNAQLSGTAARHAQWAAGYYARAAATRPGDFWRARSAPADAADTETEIAVDVAAMSTMPVALSDRLEIRATPCLDSEFVGLTPALHHPMLETPVAWLGGVELAPLLESLAPGRTPYEIARSWEDRMPLRSGLAIAGWLIRQGILVRHERRSSPC